MLDLCNMKQKVGESFVTYLQRWRKIYSNYPRQLPEHKKIDIFVSSLIPELHYDLRKKIYLTFNDMVESAFRIEDVAIKKGEITISKDKSNGNWKDKNKSWNKNKYVVNNGVVDVPQSKEPIFNLASALLATKEQGVSTKKDSNKAKLIKKPKRVLTPLRDSYEIILNIT